MTYGTVLLALDGKDLKKAQTALSTVLEMDMENKSDIFCGQLSFYPDAQYYNCIVRAHFPAIEYRLIDTGKDVFILNGSTDMFEKLNRATKIVLNEDNIFSYAQFYFDHVQTPSGYIRVLDNIDDLNWSEEPSPNAKKSLGTFVTYSVSEEKNGFILECSMLFQNTLVRASLFISNNGVIELRDRKALVEDIPVVEKLIEQ